MRIGISGHQHLGSTEAVEWIALQIRQELTHRNFVCGVSSLAEGADQLFANIVLDLGKLLEVVIPCDGYEDAFTNPIAVERFRDLKDRAANCCVLDFKRPSEKAFFEAGRRIVEISDLMIFVWNGRPARGQGGTADIVSYARQSRREFVWINPATNPPTGKST